MTAHRVVPVSKDLHDPEGPTEWRCAGCGKRASWPGSIAWDTPCPAGELFEDEEAS